MTNLNYTVQYFDTLYNEIRIARGTMTKKQAETLAKKWIANNSQTNRPQKTNIQVIQID